MTRWYGPHPETVNTAAALLRAMRELDPDCAGCCLSTGQLVEATGLAAPRVRNALAWLLEADDVERVEPHDGADRRYWYWRIHRARR